MMKCFYAILLILSTISGFGQEVRNMIPTLGYQVDRSPEGEVAFNAERKECEAVWAKVKNQNDFEKLSKADKEIYENCPEDPEDYWDILGAGCSWYCGGGLDTNTASSSLKADKGNDYSAGNIHDLNYKTAWIEGVPGYGIGESVTYDFPPENPRITEIIVVNGYVKSAKAWKDNSRVKKLKMYVDGKPFAILNLKDSREEQHFKFEPLGHGDRKSWELLKQMPHWTITFEILDVYKGDKYDDTAITEIYFDGIDVH